MYPRREQVYNTARPICHNVLTESPFWKCNSWNLISEPGEHRCRAVILQVVPRLNYTWTVSSVNEAGDGLQPGGSRSLKIHDVVTLNMHRLNIAWPTALALRLSCEEVSDCEVRSWSKYSFTVASVNIWCTGRHSRHMLMFLHPLVHAHAHAHAHTHTHTHIQLT